VRKCGDCRECCIVLEIKEINKPAGVFCDKLCAKGCGIYESRPNECRNFECLWLTGQIPKRMKPNTVHAVAWMTGIDTPEGEKMPVLRVTFNNLFKRNNMVQRWVRNVSRRRVVVTGSGKTNEAILNGESAGTWRTGEDTVVTVEGNQIIEVKPVKVA